MSVIASHGGVILGDFETAFREEVRGFLRENLSSHVAERVRAGYYLSKEELFDWQQALFRRGWIGADWPKEYGGPGWTPVQRYIFEEECAEAGAPILITLGLSQAATLLMVHGSEAQKRRFLPKILDGTEFWCQGWSEPNAGSDLAGLKCSARREGDHYVVNGTKIWTTIAHWSDWCFLLVRTDSSGRKHEGITILLVDMKSPGITIRPIISLDGMHSLNQLFLENLRVPIENRVGEEGQGWNLMRAVLGKERLSAAGVWKCKSMYNRLRAIAKDEMREGRPLLEQPRFRERLAWLDIRIRALEVMLLGIVADSKNMTTAIASLLKLRGTEIQQELLAMTSEAAGHYALPFFPDVLRTGWVEDPVGPVFATPATPFYLFWRKSSISGGSNEVMRNVIADELMGRVR